MYSVLFSLFNSALLVYFSSCLFIEVQCNLSLVLLYLVWFHATSLIFCFSFISIVVIWCLDHLILLFIPLVWFCPRIPTCDSYVKNYYPIMTWSQFFCSSYLQLDFFRDLSVITMLINNFYLIVKWFVFCSSYSGLTSLLVEELNYAIDFTVISYLCLSPLFTLATYLF